MIIFAFLVLKSLSLEFVESIAELVYFVNGLILIANFCFGFDCGFFFERLYLPLAQRYKYYVWPLVLRQVQEKNILV